MADDVAGGAKEALTPEETVSPSQLDEEKLLSVLKDWFKADSTHGRTWHKEAAQDFDFVAGDQWSEEDKSVLLGQQRVPIVFNRTLTIIKAVAGMEINGRHEISFIPRKTEDAKVDEVLSGASKWMADNCDGEDEESTAFQHALICGMGWNEHRMDFEDEPEGQYVEEAINPLEMWWDRTAAKKNLADARRLWRVRKMPLGDAVQMFPKASEYDLDAKWAIGTEPESPEKTLEQRRVRDDRGTTQDKEKHEVTIVQCQWWEREEYWLVADPATNQKHQLTDKQHSLLQDRLKKLGMPEVPSVELSRKVYKQAFLGNKVLKSGAAPIKERFTWTCITGEPHHNKKVWFGLVRVMRDPQMWANKWLVQSLHIMNTTAKGGIIAETGAFEDVRQAEETYAKPQAITWAAKGALGGPNGSVKIMPKPGGAFPQGHMELMELAFNALPQVTGINYELIGLKDVNQPGVLELYRKQAGMTVLATMFDSLRRARKQIGRIRLYFIQNFLSDGRLIRIVGQDGARVVPLLHDKTMGEYDVVVDDTPTSPNQKQANWGIISQMLPTFKEQLASRPEILAMLLEYSPLPTKITEALKQAVNQPQPDQDQQKQLAIAGAVAKINKDQQQAELFKAQAGTTQATAMYDIAMARNLLTKHQGDAMAAIADIMKAHSEAQATAVGAQKTAAEAQHTAAKTQTELATADNVRADTAAKHAGIGQTQAETHATHVGAMHQAMQPIPEHKDAFPPPAPKAA